MKSQSSFITSTQLFQARGTDIFGGGMEFKVVGLPEKKAFALWTDVSKEVTRLDKMFATLCTASDEEVDDEMRGILNLTEQYLISTERLFDVARGEELDFGGFAKGYALRQIAGLLKAAKAKDAFVSLGSGNFYALGNRPYGEGWKIELENPFTEDEMEPVILSGEALSITLNTPDRGDHIINPATQRPDCSRKMVQVKAKDALDAEVLSKVLFLAKEDQKKYILASFKGVSVQTIEL